MKANADDLFAGLGRKTSGAKAPLFEENTYHVFQILGMSVSKRRNRVVVEAKMVVEDGTIFIEKYYLHNADGKQNYAATESLSKLVEAALGIDLDNEMPTMKQVEKCEKKYIVTDVYHDQGDDGRVYEHLNPDDMQSAEGFMDAAALNKLIEGDDPKDYDEDEAEED